MSQLKMFTLNTTQEVMGVLIEDEGNAITIRNPLWLQMVQTGEDSYGIRMDPLSFSAPESNQRFFKHAIVSEITEIPKGLADAYTRQTSRIEIVSSLPGL